MTMPEAEQRAGRVRDDTRVTTAGGDPALGAQAKQRMAERAPDEAGGAAAGGGPAIRAGTELATAAAAEEEILDRPGVPRAVVERSLIELSRVNRWLLGYLPVRRTLLLRLLAGPPRQLLLDVGTGSGDVAEHLARAAAGSGREVRVVGVDRKLAHLLVGRRRHAGAGDVPPQLAVVADAAHLPFADGAADWSLSTLFFHHFDEPANRRILGEMRRVASRGAVVVDLRRNRLGARLGALLIPLTGAGPVTRHDGRVSLARAWPYRAVARLAEELPAGDDGGPAVAALRRRFPFRFCLVLTAGGR